MHVDDRVPFLLGHVGQHAVAQDAGVVDDDVQIAERLDRRVDQALRALPRRHTVAVGDCLAAHALDLLHDLLGRAEIAARTVDRGAHVVDHHVGAVGREAEGVFAPDAPAGAGHDGDAPFTQLAHLALVSLMKTPRLGSGLRES